jgi:hypothetical protein
VFIRLAICSAFCIPNLIRALPNAVFQRVFLLGYQLKMRFLYAKKWLAEI